MGRLINLVMQYRELVGLFRAAWICEERCYNI